MFERRLVIRQDFQGNPLPEPLWVTVDVALRPDVGSFMSAGGALEVSLDAPDWPDPPPPEPAGSTTDLWRHSVVELFLLAPNGRYLELELGPRGHYWLLEFSGWRARVREHLECVYTVAAAQDRWVGRANVSADLLPERPWRLSACAAWGRGEARVHAMSHPTGGEQPDFHQLAAFS